MKMIVLFGAVFFLLVGGCEVSGRVAEKDRNKQVTCTDTRDGEVFSFRTADMRDIEFNYDTSDLCFNVDIEGATRTLCKSHERTFLKCQKVDL